MEGEGEGAVWMRDTYRFVWLGRLIHAESLVLSIACMK